MQRSATSCFAKHIAAFLVRPFGEYPAFLVLTALLPLVPDIIRFFLNEMSFVPGRNLFYGTLLSLFRAWLLVLESGSGRLLYMKHIAHEHISDYEDAVKHIVGCGYAIQGIVIDGFQKLFTVLSEYRIQMCQFHMVAIIRRKLTKNPQLEAGKELLDLAYRLKDMNESAFVSAFEKWKRKWHDFLKEKTVNEITGRTIYTHQRLRSAMVSISTYLPFLFTYEKVRGMPNTNNMIEGTFTDMKKALRNHPGMIEENRKRMMNGFFLAYAKLHNEKGDNR